MIGLFFGSFNPIHLGHTSLAGYLLEHTNLEEVWFVVSPHNPLKENKELLPEKQRLELVNIAIADKESFKSSDIEFSMSTPNYTLRTLKKINQLYPDKEFTLIIGADNLACITLWKEYEFLLSNYQMLVYPRKGFDLIELNKKYPQVQIVEAPLYPISSTKIRDLIKQKKDASEWLHPLVYKYLLRIV